LYPRKEKTQKSLNLFFFALKKEKIEEGPSGSRIAHGFAQGLRRARGPRVLAYMLLHVEAGEKREREGG